MVEILRSSMLMEKNNMPNVSRERGGATLNALLVLMLLAAVLHVGFKVATVFIAADDLTDKMSEQAALAEILKDEQIIGNLVSKAKDVGIPLSPGDIRLVRNNEAQNMQISAQWDVTVRLFFDAYPPLTTRVFHFSPVIKERYTIKL